MLPDINLFHLTLPVALLFVGDWMTPTPSHRAHPFHRGGGLSLFHLYPKSILLSLRYLIWSSFRYLILTYILVTYFSIHACLAWNQLSSSYFIIHACLAWNQHSYLQLRTKHNKTPQVRNFLEANQKKYDIISNTSIFKILNHISIYMIYLNFI